MIIRSIIRTLEATHPETKGGKMKHTRKILAIIMVFCMVLAFAVPALADDVKFTEEETKDGWIKVTQEGGPTLGYAPDSGVTLLVDDGFAFKDLDQDGELDVYEDWREDANTRATDLASQMTIYEIAGLMIVGGNVSGNLTGTLDDNQKAGLDDAVRYTSGASSTADTKGQIVMFNHLQAYAERSDHGIPVVLSSDPRNSGWGKGISDYPDNMALAATFDPENATIAYTQMSKEYRALGIAQLQGPQVDLVSEPRWGRNTATFGENPALARDMTNAATSALQSTYDEDGNDLGWGPDSVLGMLKHYPGDGAAQEGRESHDPQGAYNIYPGDNFYMHLIAFIDGGLNLDSVTGESAAYMTSYSIAYAEDGSLGEQVATSYSEFKLGLLRSYGYDGVICTDWQILNGKNYGVEDLTVEERICKALDAGVDVFGGESDLSMIRAGLELYIEEGGEEAEASIRNSARRVLRNFYYTGEFENPYLDVDACVATVFSKNDEALKMQEKTVVMLKNDGAIAEKTDDEKPTVYVPLVYTPSTLGFVGQNYYSADLPVPMEYLEQYFNVVTDSVSETLTGSDGGSGEPFLAYEDIIRATPEELAECDMALVIARAPKNTTWYHITGGYDMFTEEYIPLSLQYGEYIADGEFVDEVSIAGNPIKTEVQTPYGVMTTYEKENQSYYGKAASIDNATDLDMMLYAVNNMPEDAKIIVAVNTEGKSPVSHTVVGEFEPYVDAILYGFNVNNQAFVAIAAGETEPSALLPIQLPADMDAVEKQLEDVPRDLECYVDSMGNTYDFAFGLNWSGVIRDERVDRYYDDMPTEPAMQPVQ